MRTLTLASRSTLALSAAFVGVIIATFGPSGCHTASAQTGPTITVDVAADRHVISPDIYGMNDNPYDAALGKELQVPVSRWGGDATTRYNWTVDSSNSGDDWFFMAGGKDNPTPGESADAFVDKAKSVGGKALLTIPIIDYINKSTRFDCSYPVSIFGAQQKTNPYVHPVVDGKPTDAGNGRTLDGKPIILTRQQMLRVHIPNTPSHEQKWVEHLVKRFGATAKGGVAIYEMDNEPGGWANTHRDIHPDVPTYQEIADKSITYARAVKEADATAKVDAPGDFGWAVYKGDPAKNGGLWNAEYFLKRFKDEETKSGKRLLDYFDEHYYPVPQDGQSDAVRLESTRSLWDPTYVEKNWIGQWNGAISLIPRMHEWIKNYYPGTKTAITEYNFGGLDTLNGALTQADVLGIFAREGLDLATIWGPPKPTDPGAFAFRIYRNYDGKGGAFGNTWVQTTSADQGKLSAYAAERSKDAITLLVINKTSGDLRSHVTLLNCAAAKASQVYRYSDANPAAIVHEVEQPEASDGFTATFPGNSITLFVIPKR